DPSLGRDVDLAFGLELTECPSDVRLLQVAIGPYDGDDVAAGLDHLESGVSRLRLGHGQLPDVEERDMRSEHSILLEENADRNGDVLVEVEDRPGTEENEGAVRLHQPTPSLHDGPRQGEVLFDR